MSAQDTNYTDTYEFDMKLKRRASFLTYEELNGVFEKIKDHTGSYFTLNSDSIQKYANDRIIYKSNVSQIVFNQKHGKKNGLELTIEFIEEGPREKVVDSVNKNSIAVQEYLELQQAPKPSLMKRIEYSILDFFGLED